MTSKLSPSSWRNRNIGPPRWFLQMTYLYGFQDEEKAQRDREEKEREEKKGGNKGKKEKKTKK